MFSCNVNGKAQPWVYVAIFVVAAAINVVAFLGALRMGFVLTPLQLPAQVDDTAELPLPGRATTTLHRVPSSNLNGRNPQSGDIDGQVDHEFYPVCVLLQIGDDTNHPHFDDTSLPFTLLYRLFDVAKAELSKFAALTLDKKQREDGGINSEQYDGDGLPRLRLLVGVDYPSLACKLARDRIQEAGVEFQNVELECLTREDVVNRTATGPKSFQVSGDSEARRPNLGCGTAIVGNSTRWVPQLKLEWAQLIRWETLRVIDLEKLDSSHLPPEHPIPREQWRPTVVTAFSSNHFAVGVLLLRSLGRAGMEAAQAGSYNISVVVYTLESFNSTLQGILDCVIQELNEKYKIPTEVRAFDYSQHPSWMKVNQSLGYEGVGYYGWKAVMVHTVLLETGFVLWADAGDRYNLKGLVETLNYTQNVGFSTKVTPAWVPQYVHPGVIKYFRYHVKYDAAEKVRVCDASGFGLTMDKYETIVRPWYECSITRQCIVPDGATRDDHRYDQSALTLIADMTGNPCTGLSMQVHRHMDYKPLDYSSTYPTHCYQDPLQVAV